MQVTQPKTKSSKISLLLLYILPGLALGIITTLLIGHQVSLIPTTSALSPASASTELTVQAENLTMSVSTSSVILKIAPTYEGTFNSSGPITVNVDTVNRYGYNLTMTTTTTTDLVNPTPLSSGEHPAIPTLADNNSGSGYDSASFPMNKWGYAANGSNYFPVSYDNSLRTTDGSNNVADRSNTIAFGTKLNTEVIGGNYNITLNFIATANAPSNLDDFEAAFIFAGKTKYNNSGYYAMQDMTANICSYVATPTTTTSAPSIQLIDTRDNKIYWVSKLKDGNCWMTENLDLDLNSTVALTSDTTDLHSITSWTPLRSTIDSTAYNNTASGASGGILTYNGSNGNGNFTSGWTNDNNTPYSVDPGYRYVVPKEMSGSNTNYYDNGDTFYYCTNQDTTCGGNSENGHYTIGNYYNFAAANATNNVETTLGGSANVVENASMPDSICPKGWRLPIEKTTNNEFNTLLSASNYNVTSNFNFAGLNAIRIAPLYFVRSGHAADSRLDGAGVASHAWSSTISSSTNGHDLSFYSNSIHPNGSDGRYYGYPVRCLARTSISDITYMQEFATMTDAKKEEVKATMTTGTAYQLIDNRDNEVYNVAKLADGNVWLLDNLRLDPATLLHQLTPANTNMDPNTPFTLPESIFINSYTEPNINTDYKNTTAASSGAGSGKIGVYYNYCAASAGTICAASSENTLNATYDVCPASWRMPTGGPSGEYQTLFAAYSSNSTNFQTALRTPLSGIFISGSAYNQGSFGVFWSSTGSNGDSMYFLYVDTPGVSPQGNDLRLYGYSVRCVLK